MKIIALSTLALFVGTPAMAASYSVGLGAGGAGKTSQESFAGFDGSLGTLTQVDFDLSGTTTFDITLAGTNGGIPPSGAATYTFTNGLFLYAQPTPGTMFSYQPYLKQTASGTTTVTQGNFQVTTSGSNGISTITAPSLLAAFVNSSFAGYYVVDDPFNSSVSINGTNVGLFNATIAVAAKSISGSVTYTYTAFAGTVPEPATWSLMLVGFGAIALGLRRAPRRLRQPAA